MTKEEEIAKLSIKINGSIIEIFANDEKSFYSNNEENEKRNDRYKYLTNGRLFLRIRFTAREKQTRE